MEFVEAHWRSLDDELGEWSAAGDTATLWWRDDDASRVTPALLEMMGLSGRFDVPLALATVPRDAEADLVGVMAARCRALQHGWAHANHAPVGEKAAEFGDHRPLVERQQELRAGRRRLQQLFGGAFEPVLVPPWNRVDAALAATLPGLGITGLSTFSARQQVSPHAELTQVNCHVDPIDWRNDASFRGEAWTVRRLCDHLSARRARRVDVAEATGLLTHHLRHDAALWRFLERLFAFLARPGLPVRWMSVAEVFTP